MVGDELSDLIRELPFSEEEKRGLLSDAERGVPPKDVLRKIRVMLRGKELGMKFEKLLSRFT